MFITKKQYDSTISSYEDTIEALNTRVLELIRSNNKLKKEMKCKTKGIRNEYEKKITKIKNNEKNLEQRIDSLKRKNEIYKGFIADPEGFSETCGKILAMIEDGQVIIEN